MRRRSREDDTVLVAPPMGGGMQARIEGVLTDVDGYLGVDGDILWLPAGVTLVSDDPLALRVLDGREVRIGNAITGGGGHTEATLKELGIDPDDDVTALEVFLSYVVR